MKTTIVLGSILLISLDFHSARAGFVLNPSFESNYNDAFPHYGAIDSWTGGSGVNLADGPFHNSGTPIPDGLQVGFQQGSGALSQTITGLTPGAPYWVQFFYDARACCGGSIDLNTSINGTQLDKIANVKPSTGGAPYKMRTVRFTPDSDTIDLSLSTTSSGDATIVLDAVSIAQRNTNDLALANPGFEASGDVLDTGLLAPNPLAGWNATGQYGINVSGAGPYADNGTAPEQDHVLFLQGLSSVSQTVKVVAGKTYQLSLAYNATSGNKPHLQVKAGDTVLFEEDVNPVGTDASYKVKTVSFTATDINATITIAQTIDGDQTLLVDDVRLTGEIPADLEPVSLAPEGTELGAGEQTAITVRVPAEVLALKDLPIVVQTSASGVARFVDPSGALVPRVTVPFKKNGTNALNITIQGLARGTANIQITDPAGLPIKNQITATVVQAPVRNPSFESSAAPGSPGYGAIPSWTSGSTAGINTSAGPFADNGIIPDRSQVAFQQGAGVLSQTIRGLIPGKNYWLQFFYNVRNGSSMDLSVNLAGKELLKVPAITPAGDAVPYYFQNIPFVADSPTELLEFKTTPTGDSTLLLDGVTVVQRDPGQIVVRNPSFEASGSVYPYPGYFGAIAGWDFAGGGRGVNIDGAGPFTDNGRANAGDLVLFLQGAGVSVSQLLDGLQAGSNYIVGFLLNARGGGGPEDTTYNVSVDGTPIVDESLQPVGGSNPYMAKQATFTASAAQATLQFQETTPTGDHTVLIDNVVVLPEKSAPYFLSQPAAAIVGEGSSVTFRASAVGGGTLSYQWKKNGQAIADQTSDTLTLDAVTLDQAGDYSVDVKNAAGTTSSSTAALSVLQTVPGLFGTGLDTNGVALEDGGIDPHYVLVQNADSTNSPSAFVEDSTQFPLSTGDWVANDDLSKWIGPRFDPANPAGGDYDYRLMIDLTGFDPATVVLTGNIAVDNSAEIWVNGVDTGAGAGGFGSFSTFSISGVFKPGVNQVDFKVNNGDAISGPTGLRVGSIAALGLKSSAESTPSLTIARDGQNLKISWPAAAGFRLQKSTALPGGWADSTLTPQTAGNQNFVTETPGAGAAYYRLAK